MPAATQARDLPPAWAHLVGGLAGRQHGVVSRSQLVAHGISPPTIDHRLRSGALVSLHRGVYAVGHGAVSPRGRHLAAVLACGPGAALSHRSAAVLLGFADARPAALADVTVARGARGRPGIRVHRMRGLGHRQVAVVALIPCTTVARTLADLAPGIPWPRLRDLWERAERLGLLDLDAIERELRPGRPGTATLRRLVDATRGRDEMGMDRSTMERRAIEATTDAGLGTPLVNPLVAGAHRDHEVDLWWPDARVAVELDSWTFHRSRRSFEDDRERDADLAAVGIRLLRFTWRRVLGDPAGVASAIAATVGAGRSMPAPTRPGSWRSHGASRPPATG